MNTFKMNLDRLQESNMNDIFSVLDRDLALILREYQVDNKVLINEGIWGKRLPDWIKKLVKNSKIDQDEIKNFIGHNIFLAEIPNRAKGKFHNFLRQILRGPGFRKTCFANYEKLLKNGYQSELNKYKLSEVGSPSFFEVGGFKFNERFLRHIRTVDLFLQNIRIHENGQLTVLDIGGGYSQFAYMLTDKSANTVVATLDFKEQLLLSYYFLKVNNPCLRVNSLEEILKLDKIDASFISKFDVILIPIECFNKLDSGIFNVVCNFSSFGEMSDEAFKKYLKSNILRNAKYFFTVNRLDSWPTYNNSISIMDYELHHYAPLHQMISPIWDYYYVSFTKFFIKKISFRSRNFEFIGINKRLYDLR